MTTQIAPRPNALHALGVDTSSAANPHEALEMAGLANWNVRKTPMTTMIPIAATITEDGVTPESTVTVTVPNQFASIRDLPGGGHQVFRVVGSQYRPFQNEDLADALSGIADVSGAKVETAGQIQEGRRVFVSMRLPEQMLIGGQDAVDMYLTAFNSHDGTSSLMLAVTPFRVTCANMQSMVTRKATSKFLIRKTSNSAIRIAEARKQLELTFAYAAEFQKSAEKLMNTKITNRQFDQLIGKVFESKADDSELLKTRAAERAKTLNWLFHQSPTNANIRDNAWGAYQAIGEYVDHYTSGDETSRALRLMTQTGPERLKDRAHRVLSAASLTLVA